MFESIMCLQAKDGTHCPLWKFFHSVYLIMWLSESGTWNNNFDAVGNQFRTLFPKYSTVNADTQYAIIFFRGKSSKVLKIENKYTLVKVKMKNSECLK